MSPPLKVAIDFGTTNTVVYYLDPISNTPKAFVFPPNLRHLKSAVRYSDDGTVITGEPAYQSVGKLPVILSVKRVLGRTSNEKAVENYDSSYCFSRTGELQPFFEISDNVRRTPIEVASELFKTIANSLREVLGVDKIEAILTVPAYSTIKQKEATREAAQLAGIEVCDTLDEPVAATILNSLNGNISPKQTVLVYDLGGGTFDCTLVRLEAEDRLRVLGIGGDANLGGDDLDEIIVDELIRRYEEYEQEPIKKEGAAWRKKKNKLKKICQEAKNDLSVNVCHNIYLEEMFDTDFVWEITQDDLKNLAKEFIQRTVEIVNKLLSDKKDHFTTLDKILLVGGSCYLSSLREELGRVYGVSKIVIPKVDPTESVSNGALLFFVKGNSVKVSPVLSMSVGIEGKAKNSDKKVMDIYLEGGRELPLESEVFKYAMNENFDYIRPRVLQGNETEDIEKNQLLGHLEIEKSKKYKGKKTRYEVIMSVDLNGRLRVKVEELFDGSRQLVYNGFFNSQQAS